MINKSSSMTQTCLSCHKFFQTLLRNQIRTLQFFRRGFHITVINLYPRVRPSNYNTSNEFQKQLPSFTTSERSISPENATLSHISNYIIKHPTSLYTDTVGPSKTQGNAASEFFLNNRPLVSWVGKEWRKYPYNHSSQNPSSSSAPITMLTPEIVFLGRSNSGKSSLINALTNTPNLCHVGAKPGKTTTMRAYTISSSDNKSRSKSASAATDNLVLLDMPGYGHGSHGEMGADILKFLGSRKQVRRAMVLLNPEHGIKKGDERILDLLRRFGIPYQIIACKIDRVKKSQVQSLLAGLRERVQQGETDHGVAGLCLGDVIGVGGLDDKKTIGVDEVRWAILQATGLDQAAMEERDLAEMRKQGKRNKSGSSPQQEKVNTKAQDQDEETATSA